MSVPDNLEETGTAPDSSMATTPSRRLDPALLSLRRGRWRWPWAIAGSVIIMVGAVAIMMAGDPLGLSDPDVPDNEIFVAGKPLTFVSMLVFAAALIVPTALVVRLVHGTRIGPMLGPDGTFDWRLFAKAAMAASVLAAIGLGIAGVEEPAQFAWQPHAPAHVLWLLAGAAMIVPQAFAEDFVFKGYLLRTWGAIVPWRTLIMILIAAVFTSLHTVNDDLQADLYFGMITFFATELVAIAVYLRTWNSRPPLGCIGPTT